MSITMEVFSGVGGSTATPVRRVDALAAWKAGARIEGRIAAREARGLSTVRAQTARERLAELREQAARRRRTMPDFPDTAEELQERAEEGDGWLALQARARSGLDED